MKVNISISDPWEFGENRNWQPLKGTLLKCADDDYGGLALIELEQPVEYRGKTWQYVIASPRKQGDLMSGVRAGREVFSAIIGIPTTKAESNDPFASARETWNELAIIGTVVAEKLP